MIISFYAKPKQLIFSEFCNLCDQINPAGTKLTSTQLDKLVAFLQGLNNPEIKWDDSLQFNDTPELRLAVKDWFQYWCEETQRWELYGFWTQPNFVL